MKSRVSLIAFASLFVASALVVAACQGDDDTTTPVGPGAGGSNSQGGSSAGGNGQGGSQGAGKGGSQGGGSGGSAGQSGDPCGGEEKGIPELNQVKAPLPENRLRLKGIVATSKKFLVSPSKSGCLWGVYVTMPGDTVAEYGSIQLVSKGAPPISDAAGKDVCKTDQESSGNIPNEIKPGDVLDVSGFLAEFLLANCDGTANPKPEAGQRQITDVTCLNITSSGATPAPAPITDVATLEAIAQGKNTGDVFYKWGGALVSVQANLTSKQITDGNNKYYNCSAVSGFGDINFEQTALTANNGIYFNDVSCTGPKDSAKRYDFQQPTTFTSINGVIALNFCTWELSVRSRCDDIVPKSPTCDVAEECAKPTPDKPATKCDGTEDSAELCSDKLDNDGDGFADCEDKGCCALVDCKTTAPDSYCGKGGGSGGSGGGSGENTPELCNDGKDNDSDNFADCEDKECCSVVDCSGKPTSYCGKAENTVAKCGDGQDNDGDNHIDCEDSGCCDVVDCKTSAPSSYCATKGSGGSGGSSGTPENTAALCGDNVDNDGDKFIDCEDKDCCAVVDCKTLKPTSYCATKGSGGSGGSGGSSGTPENTAALCGDNVDNDGDKFIDCEDKDCCAVVDCKTLKPTSYCATKGSGGSGGSSGGAENTAALCGDGQDNDGDKFIDCEDKDCCKLVDCKTLKPTSYCATH